MLFKCYVNIEIKQYLSQFFSYIILLYSNIDQLINL